MTRPSTPHEDDRPGPPEAVIPAWRILLRIVVFMLAVPGLLVLLAKLLL